MAVYPVGSPVNTHSATGSVTGTWGATQFRVAGHLLVAVVTCAASTSVTATATVSGWTLLQEVPNTGTAQVRVAIWTLVAVGADAAPVFTSTETGTAGGMDCMLFELTGGNTVTPQDVTATYASGASPLTLSGSTMTATTGNAAAAGEFAISVFAQEAAAGILTWTDTGTSGLFSKVLNGNGASSVLQTYVGVSASVTAGAPLNDSGAFSTNTSAFGAGLVVAFAATVNPENLSYVFANNAAATVTSGGTTNVGGVPGTSEGWTVNVSGAFPAVSQAVQPPTQFTVCDPALPAEKMMVTVAPGGTGSGQSWTVTRGAEGTVPVAHTTGFTIVNVTSAGFLSVSSLQQSAVSYVNCDYNGVIDASAAFNTALAMLPVVNGIPAGIIKFGPGKVKMAVTPNNPGPSVYVQGAGWYATNIYSYVAGGDCFRSFNPSGLGVGGGGFSGLTIWGDNATGAACGLHIGDQTNYRIDIAVNNFQGTGAIGVHFDNQYFWTEEMEIDLLVSGCTQCVVFENPTSGASTSGGSFDRLDARITLQQGLNGSNQVWGDGVVLQSGAFLGNGKLNIRGAFVMSSSATSAAVLRIIGAEPAGHLSPGRFSQITGCELQVGVEINGGFTNAPMTIFTDGSTLINNCYGVLDFSLGGGVFVPSNIGSNLRQSVLAAAGDVNLAQVADVEQYTMLGGAYTLTNNASAQPLFNATAAGAMNLNPGTYFFEGEFDLTSLSASSHTVSFGLGGGASIGSVRYRVESNTGAAGTLAAWQSTVVSTGAATAIIAAATTTTLQARIRGAIRITSSGTLIPQVTQTTNTAAAVVGINSWFRIWRTGSQTTNFGGAWT